MKSAVATVISTNVVDERHRYPQASCSTEGILWGKRGVVSVMFSASVIDDDDEPSEQVENVCELAEQVLYDSHCRRRQV